MQQSEVYTRLQKVFDETFLDEVIVTPGLTANDVEEWTSLSHVSLVLAIEQEFGIRFRIGEVEATQNVGELAELIQKRESKN
jgi:acyl carrier protein